MNIHLESDRNALRLRWTFESKRYCLGMGLKDSPENRQKALQVASAIREDWKDDCFDRSLGRYRPQKGKSKNPSFYISPNLTIRKLYQDWLEQAPSKILICSRTKIWHWAVAKSLIDFLGRDRAIDTIDSVQAKGFFDWLLARKLKLSTIRRRIHSLSSCWQWAIEEGLIKENPWKKLIAHIRIPHCPPDAPFSKEEIQKIIAGFEALYPDTTPLVQFLFSTGCRTGEALGLRWQDVSADLTRVTLATQWTGGERKLPKCNKTRTIYLSPGTQQLLASLPRDRELVFFEGKPITDSSLRAMWRRVLKKQGVAYRKPYSTRHTFISHCLEQGLNPVTVASMTGHSVDVLFKHYAGLINRPQMPDLF